MGLAAPVLVLGAWCALSYGHIVPSNFLPSPTEVIRGLLQLFFEKQLGEAILTSTRRITIAFALAAAVALPLGVLMGSFEPINRFFEPVLAPLRFMPISAFIPLLILWFGIDESEKIAFLFLGVFVYLLPVVVTAIRAVPQEYVDTAYTLGASRGQVIVTVLVPAALPEIFE
jgi:NitT/TauT family transport system permease protein